MRDISNRQVLAVFYGIAGLIILAFNAPWWVSVSTVLIMDAIVNGPRASR